MSGGPISPVVWAVEWLLCDVKVVGSVPSTIKNPFYSKNVWPAAMPEHSK